MVSSHLQGRFESESPDEEALVLAAAKMGFELIKREKDSITLREWLTPGEPPVEREYKIMAVLAFTHVRKRMSIIVKDPEGQLLLYTKGKLWTLYTLLALLG